MSSFTMTCRHHDSVHAAGSIRIRLKDTHPAPGLNTVTVIANPPGSAETYDSANGGTAIISLPRVEFDTLCANAELPTLAIVVTINVTGSNVTGKVVDYLPVPPPAVSVQL